MVSERLVECQDCGNRWESTADNPRCSKPDCGRSRNVEPVADEQDADDDGEQDADDLDDDLDDEPDEDTDEQDADDGDDDTEGYEPAFSVSDADMTGDPLPLSDDADDDEQADDEEPDESQKTDLDSEVPDIDPEQLELAFESTFGAMAASRGDHWNLDEEEEEKLAQAWAPVLNHYAPVVIKQHSVVGMALITTASVVGPRLAEDKAQAEIEEKEQIDDDRQDEPEETPEPQPTDTETAEIGGYASV